MLKKLGSVAGIIVLSCTLSAQTMQNNNSTLYRDQIGVIPAIGLHNLSGKFAPLQVDANGYLVPIDVDSATYQPVGTINTVPSLAKVFVSGADGKPVQGAPIVGMYSDGTYKPIATDGLGRIIITAPSQTGITSLNNLADSDQLFAFGSTGTDVSVVSAAGTHTFNIPSASGTARGLITTGTQTLAGAKTFSTTPTFSALSTGIIHSNSSGVLSSSTIVNTDVAANAAIDFSKLASLDSGYILVGNGSNVATKVAMSNQATIDNTGAVTLVNASVIGKVITGYTATSGTLAATDTLLQAIQKLGYDKHVAATVVGTNGLSISGQQIDIAAAGASTNGVVTTGSQTIAGIKTFTAALSFGASIKEKVSIITSSPTTLDTTHDYVLVNSASAFALNLPACATSEGIRYHIKNINTGIVTITPAGVETIDGAANKKLNYQYVALTLVCTSSNWYVF